MKKYIEKLIKLVQLERNEEIKKMEWEIKNLSGFEREKKGRAILNLKPKVIGEELGLYLIKFGRSKIIETEINVGDEVLINKNKGKVRDDFKGVVVEKGSKFIVVSLDKLLPKSFKEVRIDLYASDVTYKRQIDNLKNLSENGKKVLSYILKDIKFDDIKKIDFKPFDKNLNYSQKLSISKALSSKNFFLIHGPFGTGKTRTLVEYILQEVKRGKKVLVSADSNMAVDNLVERLSEKVSHVRIGHPSRVSKKLLSSTLLFKIEKHERYKELYKLKEEFSNLIEKREKFQKPIQKWRRGLSDEQILKLSKEGKTTRGIPLKMINAMAEWITLNNKIEKIKEEMEKLEEEISKDIIENSSVVFSTNSSSYSEILKGFEFDVVVIDEAAQTTIPSVLIPLSKGKKFVLAGDHKQLPPTIISEKAKELSITLFEILVDKYPHMKELLNIQYRMNEKIMEFPNIEFYNGKLKSGIGNITLKDLGFEGSDEITKPENTIIFIDTKSRKNKTENQKKDSTSYFNELEANIVKDIVEKFLKLGLNREYIGVITPYDDQVDLIKSFNLGVEVNTVDGFQGREKEVIIISFVRSNQRKELGFLTDLRRLNVSITRAKRKLICIGDSSTLENHPTYKKFIEFVKNKGVYLV
ncbi:IGHMBP2 family helicase [Thermosipho sp. (in: thermotogales)]|uniref:IGHMBP2 family helicase n=1 Tax=Thermosipho sp. (in: thermotogales) TaxID=1968895 RepID=UPI00257B593B|nr:IGHMBP2 family helicase [Thermosipho sp. (in: thermotogales)]MBZ4649490.1 putative helicase [Thermosipho sp. (in: thermotogales)]